MPWIWAALMPHPPVLVPEIGRGLEKEALVTTEGVNALLARLAAAPRPDVVLLLSPHHRYAPGALLINNAPQISSSFSTYDAPDISISIKTPLDVMPPLSRYLEQAGVSTMYRRNDSMLDDQGSMVPLYFLKRIWHELPPTIIASPIGLAPLDSLKLGEALASMNIGGNWGLLASGDLSHRLFPGAPAGYSPEGVLLDEAIVEAISSQTPELLTSMSSSTIERAGECGLRSILVLLGLCSGLGVHADLLSYEGPFGVGYCNAVWTGA